MQLDDVFSGDAWSPCWCLQDAEESRGVNARKGTASSIRGSFT